MTPLPHVAIVGASATGLFTAAVLARADCPVTVYERAAKLDPAARTLIVTSALRDQLGGLGRRSIINEVDRYELFANGQVGEVKLGRPDLIVERSILIQELAAEAKAAGAEIVLGKRFLGLTPTEEGLSIRFGTRDGDESVIARTLVGADGASSSVATAGGWGRQPTVPLLQAIVALPDDLSPRATRVWFRPQDTPYFYWLIPESSEIGALGVIGEHTRGLREHFDRFLADKGLHAISYQGARIPRYARWVRVHKRFGSGDVYLVGDAAGHVKVTTVGGLVTGFRGALGVAEAILGGHSRLKLRSLRRELDAHLLVRRIVHRFGETEYCRLLDLLNEPTRNSLQRHTRDEATSMLWRLALKQPRLVPLSLKGLLNRGS